MQFENSSAKRSPSCNPSTINPIEDPLQIRMGQKVTSSQGGTKKVNPSLDWEPNRERSTRVKSPLQVISGEVKDVKDLIKVRVNSHRSLFYNTSNLYFIFKNILLRFYS